MSPDYSSAAAIVEMNVKGTTHLLLAMADIIPRDTTMGQVHFPQLTPEKSMQISGIALKRKFPTYFAIGDDLRLGLNYGRGQ